MSGVNFNISVSNLPQMDRHQDDIHHGPVINQQQNAQLNKSEVSQKLSMPVEPEHTEGKTVDTKRTELEKAQKRKKKKRNCVIVKEKKKSGRDSDGYFVNIQA